MIKLKTLLKEIRSVKEDSGEALDTQKDKWITFDPKPKEKELDDEFFKLIQTAYKEIGGHAKVKSPNDVFSDPDWTFWQGVDIHGSPDLDLIVWGQHTKYGVKFSGVGHDGEKDSTREYLNHKSEVLKKPGYYGEVSGKLAAILMGKYGATSVDNKEDVEKVLGKPVEWNGKNPEDASAKGNGWYTRDIGGTKHAKILLGKPKGI
jgi:hypothetical protein